MRIQDARCQNKSCFIAKHDRFALDEGIKDLWKWTKWTVEGDELSACAARKKKGKKNLLPPFLHAIILSLSD